MLKYQLKEININGKERGKVCYPKFLTKEINLNELIEQHQSDIISPEVIKLSISIVNQLIHDNVSQGHSVKVDGFGIFSPTIKLKDNTYFAPQQTCLIKGIEFTVNKKTFKSLSHQCSIDSSVPPQAHSSTKYTPDERRAKALSYLQLHPFMHVADYMKITGLLHNVAAKELKKWAETPHSGIGVEGKGTHKVYVLKND